MPSKKWAVLFDKCDPNKQKYRQKLIPDAKCQQCRVFVRNDLVEKMIKSCRLGSKKKKNQEFKRKLGLDPDRVTCDEQEVIGTLKNVFGGEIILNQFNVNNKRIDACFRKYKIRIEINEYDHESRNSDY